MENRNFSNDITLHSTIMQCQFRKSTLLPLSFSNAITSQLDSRKRYFHLPSKRHYHRSIVEIRAKLHLASPYQKLDVYRLFLVTVEFRWMDRIAERDPFSRGIRIDSPPFKMDTSPPILQVVGVRIPPISWNVARYRWKVSRSHFANAISWFCHEICTTYLSSSSELEGQIELGDRGFWICIKSTRVVENGKDVTMWNFQWVISTYGIILQWSWPTLSIGKFFSKFLWKLVS